MKSFIIIPTRMGSTRFPGKPLAMIAGKPMLWHVAKAAERARAADHFCVVTDAESPEIVEACEAWRVPVGCVPEPCRNGTERVAFAAKLLGAEPEDTVLNLQGDEPTIDPADLDMLIRYMAGLESDGFEVASLFYRGTQTQAQEPSAVKLVIDPDDLRDRLGLRHKAVLFTRQPVPPTSKTLIHVGVYAFRAEFLARAVTLPPTAHEEQERLEQLRWLDNGARMMMLMASRPTQAVDVPDDIKRVENAMCPSA